MIPIRKFEKLWNSLKRRWKKSCFDFIKKKKIQVQKFLRNYENDFILERVKVSMKGHFSLLLLHRPHAAVTCRQQTPKSVLEKCGLRVSPGLTAFWGPSHLTSQPNRKRTSFIVLSHFQMRKTELTTRQPSCVRSNGNRMQSTRQHDVCLLSSIDAY